MGLLKLAEVHYCVHGKGTIRVVQSGIFLFTTPFERLLVYMWLLTSSCPAQRPMKPGDSGPENWREVKVSLAFLAFHLVFSWLDNSLNIVGSKSLLSHGLHILTLFTEKTKMDFTPRPSSSKNWREGNGDSRGGLPLRWGALFASTQLAPIPSYVPRVWQTERWAEVVLVVPPSYFWFIHDDI